MNGFFKQCFFFLFQHDTHKHTHLHFFTGALKKMGAGGESVTGPVPWGSASWSTTVPSVATVGASSQTVA